MSLSSPPSASGYGTPKVKLKLLKIIARKQLKGGASLFFPSRGLTLQCRIISRRLELNGK